MDILGIDEWASAQIVGIDEYLGSNILGICKKLFGYFGY